MHEQQPDLRLRPARARRRRAVRRGRLAAGAGAQGLAEGTHYVRLKNPHAGRDRQEHRGDRVLLLRLPALRRARAAPAGLAQDQAGGRAVPARPGDVPAALGEPGEGLLHARGDGRGSEALARGVRRAPRQGRRSGNEKDFLDWAASKGLDRKKVEDIFNSFAIVGKVNRAKQLAQAYNIQSVPTIVVDGKYATGSERAAAAACLDAGRDRLRWCRRRAPSVPSRSPGLESPPMRVFLTGASSGLGEALARHYAAQRRDARAVRAARSRARARSPRALAPATVATYAGDVREAGAISRGRRRISSRASASPDVVIANAGISRGTLTDDAGGPAGVPRDLRHQRARHRPHVRAVRRARCARRARGTLVGVASVAGFRGLPGIRRVLRRRRRPRSPISRSLRVELRGSGRRRGDDLPRLRRDADDRSAIRTACRSCSRPTRRRGSSRAPIERRTPLLRAAVADGGAGQAPALRCRGRSSIARSPAASASRGSLDGRSGRDVDWAASRTPAGVAAHRVPGAEPDRAPVRARARRARRRAHRLLRASARGARGCRRSAAPRTPTSRACARSRRRTSSSTSTRTGARTSTPRARSCRTSSSRIRWRPRTTLRLFALFGAIFDRAGEAARAGRATSTRRSRRSRTTRRARCRASRVLYLIWRKPWMTVARDDVRQRDAGARRLGHAARERAASRYPALDDDDAAVARRRRASCCRPSPTRFASATCASSRAPLASPCDLVDGEWTSWYGVARDRRARARSRDLRETLTAEREFPP